MDRELSQLPAPQQTALITLQAKAQESRYPDSILGDHFAWKALTRLDEDLSRYQVSRDGVAGLALRAFCLDEWTRQFLHRCPRATVLYLGCGLDSRVLRVDPDDQVEWYGIDFPEVIALRNHLYDERPHTHFIASPLTAPDWMNLIPADRPTLLIAEGVFPYLEQAQVTTLLSQLLTRFPSGELLFDGYQRWCLPFLNWHPSIRATGAKLRWGINAPIDLESSVPGLRFIDAWTEFSLDQTRHLSPLSRLMRQFRFVRQLGRLLRYRFGPDKNTDTE